MKTKSGFGLLANLLDNASWLLLSLLTLPWTFITIFSTLIPILLGIFVVIAAVIVDVFRAIKGTFLANDMNPLITKVAATEEEVKCIHKDPIVLLHGVFGFGEGRMGGLPSFGGVEKKYENVFVPDLGSLTSLHDRARELFYYLKGGQVDYGEEHSKKYGHPRFGRVYTHGKCPQWDENNPIHFVGHSAGAQVVRILQQMLADKAFHGHESSSEDWVLSLTAVCGALNGSTKTYIYGMKADDWKSFRILSPIHLSSLGAILFDWLDLPWLKNHYNNGFDHFNMSWRKIGKKGFFHCLSGKSGPCSSGDWAFPDVTIQGSAEINRHIKTFKNTFYFSYAAKKTIKVKGVTLPSSFLNFPPWFLIQVLEMCLWRYPRHVPPPYEGFRDEDWLDNDCELNTISMTHPRIPSEHPHCFIEDETELQPEPGIWYCKTVDAYHSEFVLNPRKKEFFERIFERCWKQFSRKNFSCNSSVN